MARDHEPAWGMLGAQEKNGAGIQPAPDRHDCKGVMMAVSKRTRFEVLRRDSHTCRYCGQSAPDVKLTVDHVTPVALGGTDAPSNLVAACVDCNAGKSSSSPDASLVAQVSDDAVRWAAAMSLAAQRAGADRDAEAEAASEFHAYWQTWTFGPKPSHREILNEARRGE